MCFSFPDLAWAVRFLFFWVGCLWFVIHVTVLVKWVLTIAALLARAHRPCLAAALARVSAAFVRVVGVGRVSASVVALSARRGVVLADVGTVQAVLAGVAGARVGANWTHTWRATVGYWALEGKTEANKQQGRDGNK